MPRSCPLTRRRTRDQIERAEAAADRIANNVASPFDQSIVDEAGLNDRVVR